MNMPPFMKESLMAEFDNDMSLTEVSNGVWLFTAHVFRHTNGEPIVIYLTQNELSENSPPDFIRICDYGDALKRLPFIKTDNNHDLPPNLQKILRSHEIPARCDNGNIYMEVAPGIRSKAVRMFGEIINEIMAAHQQ